MICLSWLVPGTGVHPVDGLEICSRTSRAWVSDPASLRSIVPTVKDSISPCPDIERQTLYVDASWSLSCASCSVYSMVEEYDDLGMAQSWRARRRGRGGYSGITHVLAVRSSGAMANTFMPL